MENEISANSSIVPARGASVDYANTNDVAATSNNELVAAVAPPSMQPQVQPQAPQRVQVFCPPVQVTGMASHADAVPRPVLVMNFPHMYYIKIKVPCKSVEGLAFVEYERTRGKMGLHVKGIVDVSEGRVGQVTAVRRGMRRTYAVGQFSITFPLPGRVKIPVLRGKTPHNIHEVLVTFVVPKKPFDEPDSDIEDDDNEPQSMYWE
ncbi:OLC1v1016117C1 [Oldenlandia corymbosa var. corymbosa]|uniref:OLC1v1016117C1 n=1 Tax=Oldenlandia corymbosa var. corymbosa TaxID=529605 RepID=A0AAV1E5R2_OLDCO|nr:OLC1v1016117C1 [Oldenlandia corymbosa var. corymbosa]